MFIRMTQSPVLAGAPMLVCVVWSIVGSYASAASLVGWGWNQYGQIDVPSGNEFVAAYCGATWSMTQRSIGTLTAWGSNSHWPS